MPDLYLDMDRRLRAEKHGAAIRFRQEFNGETILSHFRLTERGGEDVQWLSVESAEETLTLRGEIPDRWKIAAEAADEGEHAPRAAWSISATFLGKEAAETAFDLTWDAAVPGASPFVPGLFYGENRPAGKGAYPRWTTEDEPDDEAASSSWSFRADRAMTPLVLLRGHGVGAAVGTPHRFSHGAAGLGFHADGHKTSLSLHFPYREEPVKYVLFTADGNAPVAQTFSVRPGETVTFTFITYAGPPAWRPLLRDLYHDEKNALAPWMTGQTAAAHAAHGLMEWHYDPQERMLYETAGFDRHFRQEKRQWDRKNMHVAWNSGIPYALALARHGKRTGDDAMEAAGLAVIDRVAQEAVSPAGVFYPQWTTGGGWTKGWHMAEPSPPTAQSNTIGQAAWFLMLSICAAERWAGGDRLDQWARAAQSNLDFALKIQREDGSFGTYYHLETGEVLEWQGAGGLAWIPALVQGARYADAATGAPFANADAYRAAALKAGAFYADLIRADTLAGAPEDVPTGVTSEDGYNALIAMWHLYEETGEESWLELACHAADYALSFRMAYNTHFPATTLLGRYDFRSKGADIASPSNQHLHNYGYVCIPEMLKLWRLTGDDYYFARVRDHLFCFRQFIARADGDFNARRGMVPEQWYHTDWSHPKGYVLPLSHAWCAGWIVWVEDWLQTWGNVFIDPEKQKLYLLEPLEVVDVDWDTGDYTLHNPWPNEVALHTVNTHTEERGHHRLLPGGTRAFQM